MFALAAAALLAQLIGAAPVVVGACVVSLAALVFGPRVAVAAVPRTTSSLRLCAAGVALSVVAVAAARPLAVPPAPHSVLALLGGSTRTEREVTVAAEVNAVLPPRGHAVRLLVAARALGGHGGSPLRGTLRLTIAHPRRSWGLGDRLVFSSRLKRIANLGNPGEFDYAAWNARRGIFVAAFVWDGDDVVASSPGRETSILLRVRRALSQAARSSGDRGGALVAAVTAGDRGHLPPTPAEAIRVAGLAHVLAISGLHVGMVVGVLMWCVGRALVTTRWSRAGYDTRRVAAVAAALGLAGYSAVSGGGVSVVRSALMGAILLALVWRGREGGARGSVAVAALVVMLALPGVATEVAFQLSFAAVAVLVAYAPRLTSLGGGAPPWARTAAQLVTISFLCWAVTTPIVAHHFGRISIVAPFANPLAAPLVFGVVLVGLGGAVALATAPSLAPGAFEAAAWLAERLILLAESAAALQGGPVEVPDPGPVLTAVLVTLPFAPVMGGRRGLAVSAALVVMAGCLAGAAAWDRYRADRLEVVFVTVGQGDATVVKLPGGRVMVVDGGSAGRGEWAVAPLLRRMRVARIDYLVASHAQSDHWAGLADLARRFELGELWHAGGPCDSQRYADFVDALRGRGVAVRDLAFEPAGEAGAVVVRSAEHGWTIERSWPPSDLAGDCASNDRSLVLRVEYAASRVLLTGDVERRAEAGMLARAGPGDLEAEVLKVPHHGSRTSSSPALLAAVRPAIAVASLGRDNRYGFPHAEVERRYLQAGTWLFRTDLDGAVSVRITPAGIVATPAKPR